MATVAAGPVVVAPCHVGVTRRVPSWFCRRFARFFLTTMIFRNVRYFLPSSLTAQRRDDLSKVLNANGGEETSLEKATHVITNSHVFEGYQSVSDDVVVVKARFIHNRSPIHTSYKIMCSTGQLGGSKRFTRKDTKVRATISPFRYTVRASDSGAILSRFRLPFLS